MTDWYFWCICRVCVLSVDFYSAVCVYSQQGKHEISSKQLVNLWTDEVSSSAYFQKPQGHIYSKVLNPCLDLCVSIQVKPSLLLQLSRLGMWNVSISWFGCCQWGCADGWDWLREIIHTAKPCSDLFFTQHILNSTIHLRPLPCMCFHKCVCFCRHLHQLLS